MWKFAAASVIGSSHVANDVPCQDAHACALVMDAQGAEVIVLAAADGAGTAKHAERGATLCVETFQGAMGDFLRRRTISDLSAEEVRRQVSAVRGAVVAEAAAAGEHARDYACTFLAAVVGPSHASFCQIGDGALIVSEVGEGEDWSWVFWPQRGEFANATNFITDDDALEVLEAAATERRVEELALLTDGLERLVLKYDTRSVFSPFFEAMFAPLREIGGKGESAPLSSALSTYLGSKQVVCRTDDDTTLVLATRRRAGERGG